MSSNTYGRGVWLPLTNKSGGGVIAGDVVVVDTANNDAFTTNSAGSFTGSVGVAQGTIAAAAVGLIAFSGYVPLVNVNGSNVTRGHFARTALAKTAAGAGASRTTGTFAQFLTGGTTPDALIYPNPDSLALVNPMTTTGDIIYSSDNSGTPARLAKGAAGGTLAMGNSAVIWNAGTSMPASKATNDRYWRTDLGMEFYWDGTRWVSSTLYTLPISLADFNPATLTGTSVRAPFPHPTLDIWVVTFWGHLYVVTPNDGTKYWTIVVNPASPAKTLSTISNAADVAVLESIAVGQTWSIATGNGWIEAVLTKISTPGNLWPVMGINYRLIAT